MAENLGIGAAVYSPLGGGLLTGKYRKSPEGRLTTLNSIIQREDSTQKTATVDELLSISQKTGTEPGPRCDGALCCRLSCVALIGTATRPVVSRCERRTPGTYRRPARFAGCLPLP